MDAFLYPLETGLGVKSDGVLRGEQLECFDYLLASQPELAAIVADTPWSVASVIDAQDDPAEYVAILEKS